MNFRLEAPYPALASTILMPRPNMGNNLALQSEVGLIRMMDGSRRSYVKKGGDKKLHRFDFLLSREKMEELVDFVERYRGDKFRAVWRNRHIIGQLTLNPIEPSGEGRAGGWPGEEAYQVTIELVEV